MSGSGAFLDRPPEGTIDLGIGMPPAELLPVGLLREASASFLAEAHPFDLSYGVLPGDERFLESLAGFLTEEYRAPVEPESLVLSGGSSQALDLVSTIFARPGDAVFVEDPSYYLAFQIFRDHGLEVVGVTADEGGMRIEALEAELAERVPALVYVIPAFHNPAGHCMSGERRTRLVELARRHGFLIVADEVYQLLHYDALPPPAFGTMAGSDHVLSLGSFSKILAPAMRLGWIQCGPALRRRIVEAGVVGSGGSLSHFASHVVRHAIDLGLQHAHVAALRRAYRDRVGAMHDALDSQLGGMATWRRPEGGYFFWLRFGDDVDTARLVGRAAERGVGFLPGAVSSAAGGLASFARLSFAHYGEEEIREGVARLRTLFD